VKDRQNTPRHRLWISYPWTGREESDFSYLVPMLKDTNIDATYESLQLTPDSPLCQRIVQRLLSIEFDGWLYILTHQLEIRKTCADELIAAIDQTQKCLGTGFPIVGLLHGISAQLVPSVLRMRPCFSLGDADWKCRIAKILREPSIAGSNVPPPDVTRFNWKVHSGYDGDPLKTAIEVAPKSESVPYWRFAVPSAARVVSWGVGAAGGGEIAPLKFAVARGTGRYGTDDVTWFGAANAISCTESAYAVIAGPLPDFVCFGPARNPSGPPGQMEVFRLARVKGAGRYVA
jgi:hypothetical protein